MDSKLRQVSRLLKRYDSDLIPKRFGDGTLGIFRKRKAYDFYRFHEEKKVFWFIREWEDLVLPVTDNWTESGTGGMTAIMSNSVLIEIEDARIRTELSKMRCVREQLIVGGNLQSL